MSASIHQINFPAGCHRDTLAIYSFWREKCGDRRMPSRADIDPMEIPRALLPGISLIDVVPDERRYVYRLVGTGDVEVRGSDPTGKSVAEACCAPSPENALGCYDTVVSTKAPLLDDEPFTAPNGLYVTEETLFLPLSNDGINVTMVMVFCRSRYAGSSPHCLPSAQRGAATRAS